VAILALTSGRGSKRFLFPMMVSWVSSGMVFAYSLFFSIRADSRTSPEHPLARVLTTQAGIVLGLLMALVILLVAHDRQGERSVEAGADDGGSVGPPAALDTMGGSPARRRCAS
jgi:hypothetical protein